MMFGLNKMTVLKYQQDSLCSPTRKGARFDPASGSMKPVYWKIDGSTREIMDLLVYASVEPSVVVKEHQRAVNAWERAVDKARHAWQKITNKIDRSSAALTEREHRSAAGEPGQGRHLRRLRARLVELREEQEVLQEAVSHAQSSDWVGEFRHDRLCLARGHVQNAVQVAMLLHAGFKSGRVNRRIVDLVRDKNGLDHPIDVLIRAIMADAKALGVEQRRFCCSMSLITEEGTVGRVRALPCGSSRCQGCSQRKRAQSSSRLLSELSAWSLKGMKPFFTTLTFDQKALSKGHQSPERTVDWLS